MADKWAWDRAAGCQPSTAGGTPAATMESSWLVLLCAAHSLMQSAAWSCRGKAPSRRTLPAQFMTMWAGLEYGRDFERLSDGVGVLIFVRVRRFRQRPIIKTILKSEAKQQK